MTNDKIKTTDSSDTIDAKSKKQGGRVAVVNDLSSFGKCSLTASLPIFSCLGLQACPLPTAVLSCQTGFDEYFQQDMTFVWDGFFESWRKMGVVFDGIVSGYLTGSDQAKKVEDFVRSFGRSDTLYVVDPVLGDDGRPYPNTDKDLIGQMRRLVCMADFCTPNLTELCLLTGLNPLEANKKAQDDSLLDWLKKACASLMADGCGAVAVTGLRTKNTVKNFLMTTKETFVTESPSFNVNMSGAGDIFCSILTAKVLQGESLVDALLVADDFLTKSILDATKNGCDSRHGVNFEKYLRDLV